MKSIVWVAGIALLAIVTSIPVAWPTGFVHVLKPGRYKIEVIIEDPHSGLQQTVRHVEKCIQPEAIVRHEIFEMLSKSPASSCPKYEICAGEFRTGFMAQCLEGGDISAVGMFALEPENFRGRIEVKDGQNAKIAVEIQYGGRVGDCLPSP